MNETLLIVFTGILAFAVLMQSAMFLLTFLSFRRLSKELLPQIQKLTEKTEETLVMITDIAESIKPVAGKLAASAEIIHGRVTEVDGFLGEIIETSRRELSGIEDALNEVSRKIRGAVDALSDGILMPFNRINALSRAVRVAVGVLFNRREKERTDVDASLVSNDDKIYY